MAYSKRELRKIVKKLEKERGRHTELVSVYVPAGYELTKVYQHLQEEQGTAKNIKDAKTRGNVITSVVPSAEGDRESSVRLVSSSYNLQFVGFPVAVFSNNSTAEVNRTSSPDCVASSRMFEIRI